VAPSPTRTLAAALARLLPELRQPRTGRRTAETRPTGTLPAPTGWAGVALLDDVQRTLVRHLDALRQARTTAGVAGPLPQRRHDDATLAGLAALADAADLLHDVCSGAVASARRDLQRLVNLAERQLDPPPGPQSPASSGSATCPCGGTFTLPAGWAAAAADPHLTCNTCRTRIPVGAWLLAELATQGSGDDALLTTAALAVHVGVPAGTVRSWASRGRLTAAGRTRSGQPLYRAGDAAALAARPAATRAA